MQTRRREQFSTVHTEGPILPPDLLRRVAENDRALGGLTPEAYHLGQSERLNEVINRSWNRLLGAWAAFRASTAMLGETDTATTPTRDRWLLPLFQELGYGRLPLARGIEVGVTHYAISHLWGSVPLHLVGAGVDLDKRAAGVAGAARVSPHGLVQDLLNRSDDHLWGFASNGLRLRVLRDNVSITRQSFVEWDLESMMDGEVYADFALLWLVCHQSRVEGERPDDCWLEKWTRAAQEQGTRALDQLRNGVEQAISALGRGFLAHPQNAELRAALQAGPASGGLDTQDYYRQLLRLVYRLLFLFVAEDRDVLLDPNAEQTARERFTGYYSTARLRRLADRRVGTRHHDLYQGLRLVMAKLGEEGAPALGLPALGGYLFSTEAVRDLAEREIANHDLLDAIRALAFVEDGRSRRLVDYRNLGAEELGSVYESLLELHPELNADAATFSLTTASGNERKTTGSYYTPSSLIQCLLDSTLDPVLDEAASKPDPEAAILDLKVCDPACGSGHFLIAAAHRIAKRLAAIRTGEPEPSPEAVRTALRQVVGRCIYGVDLNPMAVELCKVSLWMEAVEPGKPLTFLDHHIQSGNSLLGTTPALLAKGIPDEAFTPIEGDDKAFCSEFRKRNKAERAGQTTMFDADLKPWEHIGNLATAMLALDGEDADTIAGQRRKQERYEQLVRSADYVSGRLLADAWCAAFVWKKVKTPELPYPITDERLREIERGWWRMKAEMRAEIGRLAEQYAFFHWHLAFPDVFRAPLPGESPENEHAGWSGGFDVVLGNPPWDTLSPDVKEFFSPYVPAIRTLDRDALRLAVRNLLADPEIAERWGSLSRSIYATIHFIKVSDRYRLFAPGNLGKGDFNVYRMFIESALNISRAGGWVSQIVPEGLYNGANAMAIRIEMLRNNRLTQILGFENAREFWFKGVDSRTKFSIYSLQSKSQTRDFSAAFGIKTVTDLAVAISRRTVTMNREIIEKMSPDTLSINELSGDNDSKVMEQLYRTGRLFVDEQNGENMWFASFMAMFHMADVKGVFETNSEGDRKPLYEAKLFHQYNHRWARFEGSVCRDTDKSLLQDAGVRTLPRFWVSERELESRLQSRWSKGWLIAWRDISRSSDERTLIVSILPRTACSDTAPLILPDFHDIHRIAAFVGSLNSHACDFAARLKNGGIHLKFHTFRQLPVLPPDAYGPRELAFIVPRVLELTYTAWDLESFARDIGYHGPPFRWDEDRRFLLRAELDALYFRLYGIERDDVDYIMETFPIVKRKDERDHGKYRTKLKILETYDALAEAERTGVPYQTRLDPPPADPRVAHPNRDGSPYSGPGWQLPAADTAPARPTAEPPTVLDAPKAPVAAAAPRSDGAERTRPAVTRLPSQPSLLDRDPLFAPVTAPEPAALPVSEPAQAHDEQALRSRVLAEAVSLLRGTGPLTARDLAARLADVDARIDRRLVNSVLHHEGADTVRYDAARYTYSLRSKS